MHIKLAHVALEGRVTSAKMAENSLKFLTDAIVLQEAALNKKILATTV